MSSKASSRDSKPFASVVESWESERRLLGYVHPYTAKKAAEKARLLLPWIGETDVDNIDPSAIKLALIWLAQHGGRAGNGLSSSTLRAAHLAGTQVLDWAIGNGMATDNPFKQVARPKPNHPHTSFLLPDQATCIATTMANRMRTKLAEGEVQQASFALAVCIAIATGMRRGEIFALEWSDVDEASKRFGISKTIKADGKLGEPKSTSSIRSIAVGDNVLQLLSEMRCIQRKQPGQSDWSQGSFILCNSQGNRASMSTFEHWWRIWADENGWTGLRFHDLRHSHATILIANGVDVKTVQMRLGHSSAEVTLSIYAHAIPQADAAAATALDAALFS